MGLFDVTRLHSSPICIRNVRIGQGVEGDTFIPGKVKTKTWEQLGEALIPVQVSYNCSGNSIWVNGTEIHSRDWTIRDDMRAWLEKQLKESKFYAKRGGHIEERPGMVNFSIVGRQCNLEERAMYVEWDEHKQERETIAEAFNKNYAKDGIIANVAGDTGIDIMPDFIKKSKDRFGDEIKILNTNILYFFEEFEWVFTSGTFSVGFTMDSVLEHVKHFLSITKKGVCFNLLNKDTFSGDVQVAFNPDEVKKALTESLDNVDIKVIEGYYPDDFTIVINKVSNDANTE